jgi:DNA mismatch repair protein MutL
MSDIIHLLPDNIANQIAAGEVIQRPASAVKELLENSIDSGATSVKLIVRDAGKTLIQVIDTGCGMSETDARMCFERHATSKIKTIDDLFAIRTMGFRGEAMASIAAVAQVEMKSRKWGEELGNVLVIEGSEVKQQEPCQCAEGTSISVKNLFYNVPARRNFLKSNPVELSHIIEEFKRIALAHPNIGFSMFHNDIELFHLKPGNLRLRIVGIFGNNYNEKVVPVEEQTDIVKIYGFTGKPEFAKKTRGEQFFFVNNRFIRNNYLNHAVFNNYEEMIPSGSFPFFVLFIDINPAKIDINVHPTKQEIKFEEEKIIYTFVRVSIKHALAKFSVTPSLDFDSETSFSMLERSNNPLPEGTTQSWSPNTSSDNHTATSVPASVQAKSSLRNWERLFEIAKQDPDKDSFTIPSEWKELEKTDAPDTLEQESKEPYQLQNRYVVSPIKSGFVLIDQQAAHERILYEETLHAMKNNKMPSQQQLFPQTIRLNISDVELLKEMMPEVNALGFDIQEFGADAFVIHGMPADIPSGNEQEMIEKLLEDYKNNLSVLKLSKRESLARSVAQQTSVKAGQPLSVKEMRMLIDHLFACEQPYVAPNGRLTFISFDQNEIEKRFQQKS